MSAHIDPVLTSIAREQIPDCYVRIHIDEQGNREVSLHAGNFNQARAVPRAQIENFDPLAHTLRKLVRSCLHTRPSEAA